jgi:hypothetical protein
MQRLMLNSYSSSVTEWFRVRIFLDGYLMSFGLGNQFGELFYLGAVSAMPAFIG